MNRILVVRSFGFGFILRLHDRAAATFTLLSVILMLCTRPAEGQEDQLKYDLVGPWKLISSTSQRLPRARASHMGGAARVPGLGGLVSRFKSQ
jgi:hypothetical protein